MDIKLYAQIRKLTANRFLWLRNNGSTLVSQIVDTVTVDMIYLYWGHCMHLEQIWPIMCFSYLYKAAFSISNTPLFYLAVYSAKRWNLDDCKMRDP